MLLAEEIVQLSEGCDARLEGVGEVGVQLGVAEVEIAVGQHEGVAAGDVEAIQEGGVVGAAGQCALEGRSQPVARVLHTEESSVRRTAEGTRADQRAFRSDGDAGKVGIVVVLTVVVRVAGERLGNDGVEVGVAATQEETGEWAILQLSLEALRAEGERVEVRLVEILRDAGRDVEELLQRAGVDSLDLMVV